MTTRLWEALDLLQQDGWCKGHITSDDGGRCSGGAVYGSYRQAGILYMGDNPEYEADVKALAQTLRELFPDRDSYPTIEAPNMDHIIGINDHDDTTFEDIELAFVKAATKRDEILAD